MLAGQWGFDLPPFRVIADAARRHLRLASRWIEQSKHTDERNDEAAEPDFRRAGRA